jgi:hypothetical protein
MILLLAIVVAILVGLVRGGKVSRIGNIPLRWGWLALVAFVSQSPFIYRWEPEKVTGTPGLREVVVVLSYSHS